MKKVKNRIATTYKTDVYDFLIDIIQIGKGDNPLYEAWIYRGSYGIKDLMFGTAMAKDSDDFLQMVEKNMYDYMMTYDKNYKEGI